MINFGLQSARVTQQRPTITADMIGKKLKVKGRTRLTQCLTYVDRQRLLSLNLAEDKNNSFPKHRTRICLKALHLCVCFHDFARLPRLSSFRKLPSLKNYPLQKAIFSQLRDH